MHQTFYIDADEEISSVIDRLRKSMAVDNYFVAPKRAIFLQSIVNLKLLKREADKIKKHVILVTQEEVVIAMASRSGIDIQRSIDGSDEILDVELKAELEEPEVEEVRFANEKNNDKSARLNNVGSSNFYDGKASLDVHQQVAAAVKSIKTKTISSKTTNARTNAPAANRQQVGQRRVVENAPLQSRSRVASSRKEIPASQYASNNAKKVNPRGLDSDKERSLEKMFTQHEKIVPASPENRQIPNLKTKNLLFIFIIVCLFLLGGVAGYVYIPSADIVIKPNVQTVKIDTDINVGSQQGENFIPVNVIDGQEQLTLQYNATGKSSSSGKKAQGTVVIYNEFDSQPQTLVATTRIQSDSGKVFRLLKTIVVPGLNNAGGGAKPGAISAEVVADQPGGDYNLEASSFKIPGFQGGPKYDKFYAKSTAAMAGGTTEGSGSAGVSQSDLDSAKQKTETALKEKISAAIAGKMQTGEIDLPQAEKITPEKSSANVKVGDGVGSFDYTATASVHVLVFSQQDVEAIIKKTPQFSSQPQDAAKNIKNIQYVSIEPAFDKGTMLLKVHAEVEVTPKIDVESFKKDLLGKNESELLAILKKNQDQIESASVNFWPTFITRTPQFSQRVKIEVEKGQ